MLTSAISGETRSVGIFGYPLSHTLSPVMHNTVFAALNLPYVYLPFAVAPGLLQDAVQAVRALNLRGVNVTIPHKETVLPFLDRLTAEAELIGAVNTIVNDGGMLTGHNTDGTGFVRALEEVDAAGLKERHVLIAGTGGAARAVAVALALRGAGQIAVAGRSIAKAQKIADLINAKICHGCATAVNINAPEFHRVLAVADIIINTTPVGMYPHHDIPPLIEVKLCNPAAFVCDLIYNPMDTALLKAARQLGLRTLSGIGMLVWQGVLAFELWTGQRPPVELMRHTVQRHFLNV